MGKQRAKIISKMAFEKAFVEGEVIMRRNLATRIQDEIDIEDNEDVKSGLLKAKEIVYGKVEVNEPG
jgi:hypothetical protein